MTGQETTTENTVTEVKTSVETSEREWNRQWSKTYPYNDNTNEPGGNTPGGNTPGGNTPGSGFGGSGDDDEPTENYGVMVSNDSYPLMEIMDEEVPLGNMVLAVLPATGDPSAAWMLFSLLSGLGLAGMSMAGKKRKED